jgi:hypothetical protein
MRMKRTLFFNLFIILSISLQAQTKMISGKIIVDDVDEVVNLEGFTILNTTSGAHTKANSNGLFSINVKENDELTFKQVGITERSLKVSESMLKKGFFQVHVNVEVIELAEMNVKPIKRYWKDNISKEETQSEKINKSLGINEEFKIDVVKAFFAAQYLRNLGVPVRYENVIGLIDSFSDKEVQTYKRFLKKKKVDKYDQILLMKDFFTEHYFINDLKIPKGNILEFIHYSYDENKLDQLITQNKYDEILLIFEEQAPQYLIKINQKF